MLKYITYVTPVIGIVGSLIIYYKYSNSHCKKKNEIKVLWTNRDYQCMSSEHNKKNCDNYCFELRILEISNLINSAKYSIDLTMHMLKLGHLCDCLIKAHQRNVKVRIIYCCGNSKWPSEEICRLYEAGIIIVAQEKKLQTSLMHHKFCIIDGKQRVKKILHYIPNDLNSILLNGSCNWTLPGFLMNYENIIITNKEVLVDRFAEEYEKIWEEFRSKSVKAINKKC